MFVVDKSSLRVGVEFAESSLDQRLHCAFYSTDNDNTEGRDEVNLWIKPVKGTCMSTRAILNLLSLIATRCLIE